MPDARAFACRVLAEWGMRGREDDVLLCVGELATNALVHGVPPGRGFLLRMVPYGEGAGDRGVRVEVHDSGGGVPAVPEAGDMSEPGESGRGLLLVSELADKWGVGERDPGKAVWCEFATPGVVASRRAPRSSSDPPGSSHRSAEPRTRATP
ncbi:ATP-binding protein [Streptomyces sp. NBC_01635]|uniref:ATP-binding protein n=1 Tax=Streptomyces sp. NBC_01635 TaxID=2975904 RepID=UPI0038671D97